MKKLFISFSLVVSILFSQVVAAGEVSQSKMQKRSAVAKQYRNLKQKADSGEKVRVIVTYSEDQYEPGQIRRLSKQQAFDRAHNKTQSKGFNALKKLKYSKLAVYEFDSNELDQFLDSGLAVSVEEDIAVPPTLDDSIPFIGADIAHANGFIGTGQTVAILDTGVNHHHPFFQGRVVAEACFSTTSGSQSISVCPNGQDREIGFGAGIDCSDTGLNCNHGSHVAGIAAGYNGSFNGVAYGSEIISVQVFSEFINYYRNCGGRERCLLSYTSDQIEALAWIREISSEHNIAAVNMSLGGGKYTSHCDGNSRKVHIDRLRNLGIATVISSGNDRFTDAVGAPGCISSAITVGSTYNSSNNISSFSNSASMVDILAPGSWIYSSLVNGYGSMSGTSMAAPHVTGAFAVLKSINPDASVTEIENALEDNGVSIVDSRNGLTFPRLDLDASTVAFENKPIAKLDKDSYSVMVGDYAEFTAYSSSNPGNSDLTYIWDFGDGVSDYPTAEATVNHTYSTMGTYELGLTVDNGSKVSDIDTATVTVYDPAIITIIVSSVML